MEGTPGLFAGAVGLGLLHGIEPGHGWPVAAGWASARRRPWQAGVLAASVIGLGHLLSSMAVVVLFFAAKSWLDFGDSRWLDWVAGGLLLVLAAWQLRGVLRHGHGHHHHHHDEADAPGTQAGIGALALFAFTLGFAHEEEFQIIALCTGSQFCLELMLAYPVAVVVALVMLTLLLIAGLERFSHRLEHAEHHLQLLSAVILALMGTGFFVGWF
jgi:ABC-type nickel/cobalt efflux system permease component RcnA